MAVTTLPKQPVCIKVVGNLWVDKYNVYHQVDPALHYTAKQLWQKMREAQNIVKPRWIDENGGASANLEAEFYNFDALGICFNRHGAWFQMDPKRAEKLAEGRSDKVYMPAANVINLAFVRTRAEIIAGFLRSPHLWRLVPALDEQVLKALSMEEVSNLVHLVPLLSERDDEAVAV